ERYGAILGQLGTLPVAAELPYLFQVDLVKSASRATLGGAVVDEILRAVDVLRRVTPAPTRSPLGRFRDEFVERYGLRDVPLVEALDEEAGLGFAPASDVGAEASPLLDGLPLPRAPEDPARRRDPRLAWLASPQAVHTAPLELTDSDVRMLARETPAPLPDA